MFGLILVFGGLFVLGCMFPPLFIVYIIVFGIMLIGE